MQLKQYIEGNFIALNSYTKTKAPINDLSFYEKKLEEIEIKPKAERRKEIIKGKQKINEI